MARQGSGWSLAQCEERVTFKCEGCGRRWLDVRRFVVHDLLWISPNQYTVCSLSCLRRTEAEDRRKERDEALHLLVCDTWHSYRCADIQRANVVRILSSRKSGRA